MKRILGIVCLLLCVEVTFAQKVTDVTARQVDKNIHISYTLDKPSDISVYLSTDGGVTYSKLLKVSGGVGKSVSSGRKTIVWDVLEERESLVGDNIVFKVRADGTTVTDIDGNVYKTVRIGNQVWMAENLRTTRYADGTSIPLGKTKSSSTAYRYYPDNNSANVSDYGYLYNWSAVMNGSSSSSANPSGVQGVCPDGWHVPSDAEWSHLFNYVSSQNQYVCGGDEDYIAKALASEEGWNSTVRTCAVGNNPSGNNATGFSARPAGYYYGYYDNFGYNAYFWSAAQNGSDYAYYRNLGFNSANVHRNYNDKYYGYSVRCVRNDEEVLQKKQEKPVSYSTFFTLNAAYSSFPQWSYGFMVGQVKTVGWYLSAMTSFEFQGFNTPYFKYGEYTLNGNEKAVRYSLQAGFVVRTCEPLYLLLGVGYGYRTFSVQTVEKKWYRYPASTHIGLDLSLGLMFKIKPGFILSMEAVTTKFKTLEAKVGIGFNISNKKTDKFHKKDN